MKWYEVELEIPIYGKNFETVQRLNNSKFSKIQSSKFEMMEDT